MGAKFVLIEGEPEGLELSLGEGAEWVVGRDQQLCKLVIKDSKVSRRHLMCRSTPEGFTLENLSTTNPVLVNGVEITDIYALKDGDEVRIGSGKYSFIAEADAPIVKGLDGEEDDVPEEDEAAYGPEDDDFFFFSEEDEAVGGNRDTIFKDEGSRGDVELAQINFDMVESGRWMIKVINGPNAGAEFGMQSGSEHLIGTDAVECDIIFHDISISQKHARISVSDDNVITIEDVGSRNGTYFGEDCLESGERRELSLQMVVTVGTTSFVVIDKEAGVKTIISPILPLRQSSVAEGIKKASPSEEIPSTKEFKEEEVLPEKHEEEDASTSHGIAFFFATTTGKVLIAVVAAILLVVGIGTITLYDSEDVVIEKVDVYKRIREALKHYSDVQFTFNKTSGKLFLLGHVLTSLDKKQLIHNIKSLEFITGIADNIIIDELVWKEMNQTLQWNPMFRGISMHSPRAGLFVLSGYLQSKEKAEALGEYVSLNFPYLDRLENRVVVEEEITEAVTMLLDENNFVMVNVDLIDGELTLAGSMGPDRGFDLKRLIREFEKLRGVRLVRNLVIERKSEEAAVANITEQYKITGNSKQDSMNVSVVINGRILARGDNVDGMTITSIRPSTIFLERGGIKYRIDYK